MVTLKEAVTKSELKQFVKFPFSLYKDSPYWVPPIINDELESFDKTKNPAFQNADAWFFLAYKNDAIVGRIVVIINRLETNDQGIKKVRFGWFDFVDDTSVSEALLEKVAEIGSQHQLEYMEGPVGFSNLDKSTYERLGFIKEKEYMENKFPAKNADPKLFTKLNSLIKRRYGLREINFTKTKEVMPLADQMFDLFNETYSKLSSFVPITEVQKAYFKKKYISFINPEYIKFIVDKEDKLVAFAIVMPSFSKALQKAKGKLFPFGIYHLLQAKKKSKDVYFYLVGIHPEYQNKGVTAIIFNEYHKTFNDKNIDMCYRTPELEENIAIKQMWKHFDPVVYKRRRTYRKDLN
ncbi:putative uncharacterized protein YghO [Nymphon striatum]|nr:putative uncharacterized protein YghO [Nymphon striatum]